MAYTWHISALLHLQNLQHPIAYQHFSPPSFHAACSFTSLVLPVCWSSHFLLIYQLGFICFVSQLRPIVSSNPLPKSHNVLDICLPNSPALKTPVYWTKPIICHLTAWGARIPWTKPSHIPCVCLSPSLQSPLHLILAFPSPPPMPFTAQKEILQQKLFFLEPSPKPRAFCIHPYPLPSTFRGWDDFVPVLWTQTLWPALAFVPSVNMSPPSSTLPELLPFPLRIKTPVCHLTRKLFL